MVLFLKDKKCWLLSEIWQLVSNQFLLNSDCLFCLFWWPSSMSGYFIILFVLLALLSAAHRYDFSIFNIVFCHFYDFSYFFLSINYNLIKFFNKCLQFFCIFVYYHHCHHKVTEILFIVGHCLLFMVSNQNKVSFLWQQPITLFLISSLILISSSTFSVFIINNVFILCVFIPIFLILETNFGQKNCKQETNQTLFTFILVLLPLLLLLINRKLTQEDFATVIVCTSFFFTGHSHLVTLV